MNLFAVGRLCGLLLLSCVIAGCDQNVAPPGKRPKGGEPAARETSPPAREAAPATGQATPGAAPAVAAGDSAAGIAWSAPPRWVAQAPRPMRAATYRVPAAGGDPDGGECAVFFFGAGQGGDVDANLKRWYGQFEQPGGKSSEQAAQTARRTINGLKVTTVDLAGTYLASAGPMSPVKESQPGYRLLGAIVEAPQGNVFFKFTGPAKTAAASADEFQGLLKSLRKQ